jgi:hypothetical protein
MLSADNIAKFDALCACGRSHLVTLNSLVLEITPFFSAFHFPPNLKSTHFDISHTNNNDP